MRCQHWRSTLELRTCTGAGVTARSGRVAQLGPQLCKGASLWRCCCSSNFAAITVVKSVMQPRQALCCVATARCLSCPWTAEVLLQKDPLNPERHLPTLSRAAQRSLHLYSYASAVPHPQLGRAFGSSRSSHSFLSLALSVLVVALLHFSLNWLLGWDGCRFEPGCATL